MTRRGVLQSRHPFRHGFPSRAQGGIGFDFLYWRTAKITVTV